MSQEFDFTNIIGTSVIYQDYLGQNRYGKIAIVEPYDGHDAIDPETGKTTAWVYIADEDEDMNIHEFIYPDPKTGQPLTIMYCEVRLSTEVYPDDGNN